MEMLLTIFPSKRSSKISFQTSPEVRHQFRRKLRQLHSGNHWCLRFAPSSKVLRPRRPGTEPKNGEFQRIGGWWHTCWRNWRCWHKCWQAAPHGETRTKAPCQHLCQQFGQHLQFCQHRASTPASAFLNNSIPCFGGPVPGRRDHKSSKMPCEALSRTREEDHGGFKDV